MRIEKIEVPAFRVLRDVVLEFGEAFDPQIFPIGSENGGGKSTLLQLIFVLLHCNSDNRLPYLANLLASDIHDASVTERMIARLTIVREGDRLPLEFVSRVPKTITGILRGLRINSTPGPKPPPEPTGEWSLDSQDVQITDYRCPTPSGPQERRLICRCAGLSTSQLGELLKHAARKVFLLGPSNQQYLFLGADTRKALLRSTLPEEEDEDETPSQRPQIQYLGRLDEAEQTMKGFFPYDWLSVDPLVKLFASARDEDFKNVVKTGSYGNTYNAILREVNGLLFGKTVRPLQDLSGVEFIVTDSQGRETALSPEDLSQGELKRLMIYAWLRASNADDAVVLIDEIEASFHPDWQVGIVRDLHDWGPRNQYLLATHSYDLCQALTPQHVRELQPRLRRGSTPDDTNG